MLKTLRAGALALAALFAFGPLAAQAACPTAPTFGNLSGLDAGSVTRSLRIYDDATGYHAAPLLQGWDGSTLRTFWLDSNCDAHFVADAGEAHIGEVGGRTAIVGASFTTTATTTALADGQLLANSATAGSVTPLDFATVCRVNQGTGMIRRARVKIADTGLAGKILVLKLYRDSPTVTNGDHGAWLSSESNFIGQIPVTLDQHFSDPFEKGVGAPAVGSEINFDCASASTHLYGLLVSSGASGTLQGSKVVTVVLEVLEN